MATSGWNRPSANKPITPRKNNSVAKGLVACLIVVLGAAIAAYLIFSSPERKPAKPTDAPKKDAQIAEVTPAAAPKYQEKTQPAEKKVEKPIWERPMPEGLTEVEQAQWKRRVGLEKKLATDPRLQRYLKNFKPRESIYHSGTEQVLDWIFFTKLGDHPPPPLPPMAEFEKNHLYDILDSVNEIGEKDDATTRDRKKIVDEVKKDLKKFVDEGGDPRDFMEFYYNELVRAYDQKSATRAAIEKVVNEESADLAIDYIDQVNKKLEEKGIEGVELTEDQKQQLSEGLNQNDKH